MLVVGAYAPAWCRLRPWSYWKAPLSLSVTAAFAIVENKMLAFIRRFLLHYGIYRRYPLGRFPALRNAWRAAQP